MKLAYRLRSDYNPDDTNANRAPAVVAPASRGSCQLKPFAADPGGADAR
jgi:hypothetical protein